MATVGQSENQVELSPADKSVLTSKDISDIEMATVSQSENEVWHYYRKGRITASNFYASPKVLPALQYGRNTEASAKKKYLECL